MDLTLLQGLGQLWEKYGIGTIATIMVFYLGFIFMRRLIDIYYPDPNKIPGQKKTVQQIKALNEFEIKVNGEVNRLIDTIRERYDADRVAVMQYHNWTTYLSGSHNVKVSMTHESVRTGVGNLIRQMQDIPSALFTHANSNLLKGEDYTIIYNTETNDGNADEGVIATYRSIGYTSVYAVAIRKWWHLVGKVVVGYLSHKKLYDEDIEDITNTVKVIEWIINL